MNNSLFTTTHNIFNVKKVIPIVVMLIVFFILARTGKAQFVVSAQTTPELKVMTYNVLYNSDKDANFHRAKMATLAQYLKDNQIEIIGLQEMLMGKNDMVYLRDALKAINYPMPYVADGQDTSGDFRNVLFSKYKINNFKEVPVSGGRSVLDMDIDTPLGNYTFLVMHLIHTDPCGSFKKDIIPLLQSKEAKSKKIIFMGDMNITFYNSWCDVGSHREQYSFSCFEKDGTRTCPVASFSVNSMIDYIAIHVDADAKLASSKVETSLTISDHKPVVATIVPKTQVQTIRGDFNNDGLVNIYDVNVLLPALHTIAAKFSLTGTDNFIDLFDYNELLKLINGADPSNQPVPNSSLPANMIRIPADPFQMG